MDKKKLIEAFIAAMEANDPRPVPFRRPGVDIRAAQFLAPGGYPVEIRRVSICEGPAWADVERIVVRLLTLTTPEGAEIFCAERYLDGGEWWIKKISPLAKELVEAFSAMPAAS